jgi:cytoskeleton protein RodZ
MKTETPRAVSSPTFDCDVCGARLDPDHMDVAADGAHCTFCGARQHRPDPGQPAGGAAPASLDVGDELHDARLTRGETLEQASHFTQIRLPYLRALEHDDASVFEPFPGMTYARYFLRDYAEHLGIDPGPLVRRFDREVSMPVVVPVVGSMGRSQRAPHPRRWAAGALVVLIVALVASGLWSARGQQAPVDRGRSAATSPALAPSPGAQAPSRLHGPGPPVAAAIVATLRTTDRPSWVRVEVNGTVVQEATVPSGQTLRFRATQTFGVRLGDAGAVVLLINGRRVPTGSAGAIADLAFTIRDGRVVQQ